MARSRDGGRTWEHEAFTAPVPGGGQSLSGDEHVDAELQAGPHLTAADFVPLVEPIDFTDPDTAVLVVRTDIVAGSQSWFYVSRDHARSWSGPHRVDDFGEHRLPPTWWFASVDTS